MRSVWEFQYRENIFPQTDGKFSFISFLLFFPSVFFFFLRKYPEKGGWRVKCEVLHISPLNCLPEEDWRLYVCDPLYNWPRPRLDTYGPLLNISQAAALNYDRPLPPPQWLGTSFFPSGSWRPFGSWGPWSGFLQITVFCNKYYTICIYIMIVQGGA